MEEYELYLILKEKYSQIELGISKLLKNVLEEDYPQSEDLSHLESEKSKVYELDSHLIRETYISIWDSLKNVDLSSENAYLYLGLIMDHDGLILSDFLKIVKSILQNLQINYQELINRLESSSINSLIKLMTIFSLTEKVEKDKLDKENIMQIICVFQNRFPALAFYDNFFVDLLIRRFLQFLDFTVEWNMGGFYKLGIDFWKLILDSAITEQTFNYIFPVLSTHISFTNNNKKEEYRDLIFHILSRKEQLNFPIDENFFLEHKDWVSFYIQFYWEYIPKNGNSTDKENIISEIGISSAIPLLVSYITNKNCKSTQYLIKESQLIRIFDFSSLLGGIYIPLNNLVELQLMSQFYDIDFLRQYFSNIKNIRFSYELSIAKNAATQLMLFSCLDIESGCEIIKNDFLSYAENFFRNFYEHEIDLINMWDGIRILCLISQYFPSFLDKIYEIANEIDQNLEALSIKSICREWLLKEIDLWSKTQLSVIIPTEFIEFIDSLICYLRSGDSIFWKKLKNIALVWNEDFIASSDKYEDNNYWARVLVDYCWKSKICFELKNFWKNKKFVENEHNLKEEYKEISNPITETSVESSIYQNKDDFNEKSKEEISLQRESTNYREAADPLSIKDHEAHTIIKEISENVNISIIEKPKTLTESGTYLQAQLLEKLKSSVILKILFDTETPIQAKKWVISQLSSLFSLSINNINFIMETVSVLSQLISKSISKADSNQIERFKNIATSEVVIERLNNEGLDINPARPYYENVYFANLPFDFTGISVFGGDILINSKYNSNDPLSLCAQNIIFAHEFINHIRTTTDSFYQVKINTPPSPYLNNGNWQFGSENFCVSFVKINSKQIEFLSRFWNWDMSLKLFRRKLRFLYSRDSDLYQLGKDSDGCYSLERRGHNDNYILSP